LAISALVGSIADRRSLADGKAGSAIASPITESDYPRSKALDVYDLGEELLIYNDEDELGITLNASSKQIWQLCDGTLSLHQIATAIGQQLGCDGEILLEDIHTTVMKFRESGLLEN
jgi:hypothetical protein